MSRLEEMKEISCFACHVEILWKDPMCIRNNKSYCRNCYLQVLRKQNQHYKQALEEMLISEFGSEGLGAERELERVTDIAMKALEESE